MKENNFLAITYIMLGMTAFALQDTVIRLLAVDISILQVMFARSVVALILLTLFLKITKKEIILKTEFPKLSIFRTVMFILAFVFYYIGLHYLTFAEATILSNVGIMGHPIAADSYRFLCASKKDLNVL